ncbi:clathrin interactor EPSIN 2-like isoform X2 [Zingiber officinale]|uniref:clathrin interactor EPSIN 2-like isoform X2 n=1 Tax=Zingiber officinale TaxID=94328 RepID=UPI001C4CBBF4|nr:clathrin interactor EPSIN 2-like isoform X2 [Zingiber officinale]
MKKAFDQTVRDLKREVNKKVLKVPRIEQKILDATSNEPWGPHGSLLADIAQATRNSHECQMIMNAIWKRINDTGKNWRHVYKALTVLDYLVAHGSERVIDDIKEHTYQISTLSDFQYIDSSGRDQGNNVRRKSQALVALVNDKERIQEARQKAAANRDKFRSTFSSRPGSYPSPGHYGDRYDDERYESRYGSRDDDQYGNGKEREWGYRDEDKSGRASDPYGREGDRYGRYSDERYGKDDYRDDENRGVQGNDDYQYGSKNTSLGRGRSFDDDDRSISGGGRIDDLPRDDRQLDSSLPEQSIGAPPSYEDAMKDAHSHLQEDRNSREVKAAVPSSSSLSAPASSFPRETVNQDSSFAPAASSSVKSANHGVGNAPSGVSAQTNNIVSNGFDEFDPRGSVSAASPAATSLETNFFGSAPVSDPIYSLALVPVSMTDTGLETDLSENSGFAANSSASAGLNQSGGDPFGDAPFKATQESIASQQHSFAPGPSFNSSISIGGAETLAPTASKLETTTNFDFDGSNPVSNGQQISFASSATLTAQVPTTHPSNDVQSLFGSQIGAATFIPMQESQPVALSNVQGSLFQPSASPGPFASWAMPTTTQSIHSATPVNIQTNQLNLLPQAGLQAPINIEVKAVNSSPSKDKFETKSTVWADTLSRGLVNLNISGSKINPHADIGVDFDSINRKDKWKEEKKLSTAPTSITTMGKAMGSGSGIGRTGASALSAPLNSGIGMGMGGGAMGRGMGMGGYSRPMGMMMGTNMGMNQGMPSHPAMGAPGVGYNPMMNMGNYGSQQPDGRGYR